MNRRLAAAVAGLAVIAGCSDDADETESDESAVVESVSTSDGCAALRDRLDDGLFSDPDRQGELARVYADAKAFAPDDIDDDLDVLVDAYNDIAVAMDAAGDDAPRSTEVAKAASALNSEKVSAAIVTAHAYFDEECPTGS